MFDGLSRINIWNLPKWPYNGEAPATTCQLYFISNALLLIEYRNENEVVVAHIEIEDFLPVLILR